MRRCERSILIDRLRRSRASLFKQQLGPVQQMYIAVDALRLRKDKYLCDGRISYAMLISMFTVALLLKPFISFFILLLIVRPTARLILRYVHSTRLRTFLLRRLN